MQKKVCLLTLAIAAVSLSPAAFAEAEKESATTFSGELSVDAQYGKGFDDSKTSDIYVDTFLLNIDHEVNKHVALHVALLHEEAPHVDDADIGIDEAFITIKPPAAEALSLIIGRQFVPFGLHTSNMISDPLALNLSEVNDTAFTLSYSDGFAAHAFIMNGNTKKAQDDSESTKDHAREFGVGYGYETDTFSVGLDWINSIAEANSVVDVFGDLALDSYVPGASLYGKASFGEVELLAEYVTATKDFQDTEFTFNDEGARPAVVSLEANYKLGFNEAWIGIRYDQTKELLFLGAPKSSISLGYGQELFESTHFAVELYSAKDYDDSDSTNQISDEGEVVAVTGSGESANGVAVQVGVAF